MIHLTLALAILVSNVVLKPFYIACLFAADMTSGGLQFQRLQLLGELLLLLGLAVALFVVHRAQLARRLPTPAPGRWAVVVGVYLFFAVLAVTIANQFIAHAVYIIGAFPTKYLLNSAFTWPAINTLLLFGVGRAFLAARAENAGQLAP